MVYKKKEETTEGDAETYRVQSGAKTLVYRKKDTAEPSNKRGFAELASEDEKGEEAIGNNRN